MHFARAIEGWLQSGNKPETEHKKTRISDQLPKPSQIIEAASEEDRATHHEMLVMMNKVLVSNTVYQPALASNIRAFYQAVKGNTVLVEESDHFTLTEMMIMTSNVLESRTIYRSALVSNIVAFHQAVQGEQEMSEIRDKMTKMEEDMAANRAEIQELKALVNAKVFHQEKKREAI